MLTLVALTITGLGTQQAYSGKMTNGQYPYGPSQISMNNAYGSHAYRNSGSGNGGFSFGMNFSGRPALLHGVNFKYDSAELTPESGIVLDRVVSRLRVTPKLAV